MKDIDVESRDKTGSTTLHLAATEGHVEIVELRLNRRSMINTRDNENHSPIYRACQNKNNRALPVVSLLIARGASLDVCSDLGYRPLHIAAANGDIEIVKALIAGHVNARTIDIGVAADGLARRGGFLELSTYLNSIGAVDEDGDKAIADGKMIVIVDGDDDDVSVASVLPDKVEKVAGVIDVPPPVGDVVVLADNINNRAPSCRRCFGYCRLH